MEKLRRLGQWFWLNKERMVLMIMVLVLSYQVYVVVTPQEPPQTPNFSPPGTGEIDAPSPPEEPAPPPLPPPTAGIVNNNPFTVSARPPGEQGETEQTGGVTLRRVMNTPTGPRARIEFENSTSWYEEGDTFDGYEVISIDAGQGSAVVFDDELGRNRTLTVQNR